MGTFPCAYPPHMDELFQVTIDPIDEMIQHYLMIEPYKHEVLRHDPFADFLNRETERDDLFTYHHRHTGNIVIAAWAPKKSPSVDFATELTCFSTPAGFFDSDFPSLEIVKLLLKPAQEKAESAMKHIRDTKAAKKAGRLDNVFAARDMAKHLRHRGMVGSAQALMDGAPFVSDKQGGDHLAQTQETLLGELAIDGRKPVASRYDHLFNPATSKPSSTQDLAPISTPNPATPSIVTP